jgi:hypothetical protein
MNSDLLKNKGYTFAKNISNLSDADKKKRAKDILVYFTMEKVLIGIGVVAVLLYTIWILISHRDAKTDKERKSVEFNHEVLWGNAGTDGTLHFSARLIFGLIVLMFTGKYFYYMYKNNIDLFQENEESPEDKTPL